MQLVEAVSGRDGNRLAVVVELLPAWTAPAGTRGAGVLPDGGLGRQQAKNLQLLIAGDINSSIGDRRNYVRVATDIWPIAGWT